jgi:hypothetical protein
MENGVIFPYEFDAPRRRASHLYLVRDVEMVPSEPPLDEDRFRQMLEEPERYGDIVGAALCKEHAELKPISVTLIEVEQKDFEREDRRAGKSPFDLEFLDTKMVKTVQCPAL